MSEPSNRRRIDVVLVGGTDREFEVYGDWIERCYGSSVHLAHGTRAATDLLHDTAIVLVDLGNADAAGLAALTESRFVVTIVDAAHTGEAIASSASSLVKPLSRRRFKACLDPLIEKARAVEPAEATGAEPDFESLSGVSGAMKTLLAQMRRVARSEAPVFIQGEAGTGKRACARAVHDASDRAAAPFAAIDCAAVSAGDLDRALFGEATGAFETANGGTLYLDNIEAANAGLQAKLLHYLQTGTVMRPAAGAPCFSDVRLVCGTTVDLRDAAASGTFRQELFYRLFVLPLAIPPLRDRPEDILPLARQFLHDAGRRQEGGFSDIAQDAERALKAHDWPGNVSELRAVIQQIAVLNDGDTITASMLPSGLAGEADDPDAAICFTPEAASQIALTLRELELTSDGIAPLWLQEQRIIETALAACEGHVGKAAEALQISPSTIYRKMQSWVGR
ncbi:MAG: sigma-54-dependent Fis family transcriptional regulator [Rhodobiaceae bacterium]|nr:sigma-54-dependent Fis family transcriptional regulator [Rhodobiaceae bacterium]